MTKKTTKAASAQTPDEIVSSHPSRDAINRARAVIRDVVPRAVEGVKWNAPSFATEEHFATFFLGGKRQTPEFQLVLHLGTKSHPDSTVRAHVHDPERLLEWRSPDRAVISFRNDADVVAKEPELRRIVSAWADWLRVHGAAG